MKIEGRISQIKPNWSKNSYLNIDEAGQGGLKVWFHVGRCPTYIAMDKCGFAFLFQFEDKEWAEEYFAENKYDVVREMKNGHIFN